MIKISLPSRIRSGLIPPVFLDDPIKTHRARILNAVLVLVMVVMVVNVLGVLLLAPHLLSENLVSFVVIGLSLGLLYLLRRGYVHSLSLILLLVSWLLMVAISGFTMALFDSFAFYYMLIVVIAGLLLGAKGAVGFSMLCLFSLIFTAYLPNRDTASDYNSGTDATLFNYVITFATLAGLLTLADRSIQHAINRAYASEAAVKDREMKLRLALSAANLMDWDWDVHNGEITWGQQSFGQFDTRQIMNYTSFKKRIYPDDWELFVQAREETIQNGNTWSGEFRMVMNPGLRWVAVYSRPVPDDAGRTVRVIGIVQDITERKAMEQQALELTVERKQNKTLTEFIGKLSHDLKNPISVIMVSLELLERIQEPARKQEKIQHIRAQTKRLHHLIQDSLMMNRLEYVTEPTLLPIQLNLMVGGIEERTRPIAERKQIQIVMELEDSLPLVKVNEVEFHGALENLLENALNYTPDGGTVTIRTASRSRSIVIEFQDTGIGISAADRQHIFERFHRGAEAKLLSQDGSGLGLAIVQRVIERHNAQIEVESQPGQGSLFRVILPPELSTLAATSPQ